jgi:hypothetical protein
MYVHTWKNVIVVHNTKKQGFTYQKSLWMSVVYRCQHLSMLHVWFCKICTFVKLDTENAVTLSHGYNVGMNSTDRSHKLNIMPERTPIPCNLAHGNPTSCAVFLSPCHTQTDVQQLILHSCVLIECTYSILCTGSLLMAQTSISSQWTKFLFRAVELWVIHCTEHLQKILWTFT